MYPDGLYYSKEHEWVAVDGNVGTIGITFHAQKELGDIVYVEVPEVGLKVQAGGEFGTVESVKAVSEVYSPVSGEVIEGNAALRDAPDAVNRDPYGEGWIAKVRIGDLKDLEGLMDAATYAAYVEGGSGH